MLSVYQLENDHEPMWPMQWPSSSKVARVSLVSLLLRQLSGIPLRLTVVRGTKHSSVSPDVSLYMLSPSSLYMAAFCFISSTKAEMRASIWTACLEKTWERGNDNFIWISDYNDSDLEDLGDSPSIFDDAELNEEAGKAVLVVLLAGLGVVPGQLLKLQAKKDYLQEGGFRHGFCL